jgi:lipopolysaccharide biosynthesis glycosyltransferase
MIINQKNLLYTCVFSNKHFIKLLELLLISIKEFGNVKNDIDVLVLTHFQFKNDIKKIAKHINLNIIIYCMDFNTIPEAKSARLYIFNIPFIQNYNKILYLDTDIIITNDLHNIFNNNIEDKLYVVEECDISGAYFGKEFFNFNKIDPKTPAFNSGVLYFKPCKTIKVLFKQILEHILTFSKFGSHVDQPFFNYHTISKKLNDTSFLYKYSTNNPHNYTSNKQLCICHFAGNYNNNGKYQHMYDFLEKILIDKK